MSRDHLRGFRPRRTRDPEPSTTRRKAADQYSRTYPLRGGSRSFTHGVEGCSSVGRQGDAFDNPLAESVIGLFKTEVIRRTGTRGRRSRRSSSRHSCGSTGSTRGGCLARSGTSRQQSSKRSTMPRPPWRDSTNSVSDDPGTLHERVPSPVIFSASECGLASVVSGRWRRERDQ